MAAVRFIALLITVLSLGVFAWLVTSETPTHQESEIQSATLKFKEIRRYDAPEATQGVAADDKHFYAIANSRIAKYDREGGQRIAAWKAGTDLPLRHLNSGIVRDGKLYCANSNFPEWPETSSIEIWDTATMQHIDSHSLGICQEGSLTWIEPVEDGWYAVFANYSKKLNDNPNAKNHRATQLVKFDKQWRRSAGWVFPKSVLDRFDPHSCSGGGFGPDGKLYCTGHDRAEVYQLDFPKAGSTLLLAETITAPIKGQGIAFAGKQLWGIDRSKRQVVVTVFESMP